MEQILEGTKGVSYDGGKGGLLICPSNFAPQFVNITTKTHPKKRENEKIGKCSMSLWTVNSAWSLQKKSESARRRPHLYSSLREPAIAFRSPSGTKKHWKLSDTASGNEAAIVAMESIEGCSYISCGLHLLSWRRKEVQLWSSLVCVQYQFNLPEVHAVCLDTKK